MGTTRDKAVDALLGAIIKTVEELEAFVVMLENVNTDEGGRLVSKLREIANLFDKLPLLANDLSVIKRRLRGMLSSDPDKTPRAASVKDFQAVEADTRFEPVEEERRTQTRPGIGVTKPPLPKKTPH